MENVEEVSQGVAHATAETDLPTAMTAVVLAVVFLAERHSITLDDAAAMFLAGVQSASGFLARELH